MKALIIGAAGFVGKHLIDHLRALNWDVAGTRLPNESIAADIEQYELDILDLEAAKRVLGGACPGCIFHLAAQSSVALSWKSPSLTVDVNVKGAANVLEAVRLLHSKPKILLIGSSEEYGPVPPPELPINESAAPKPGNIYAATKAAQGMLGQIYAKAYAMDIVMTRSFNHIGPGQPETFVIPSFCKQVAEIESGLREPVLYTGDLTVKRDITDVRDIVRAYALLVMKGAGGGVYNVGSGKAIAVKDALDIILSLAKIPIQVKRDPERLRPSDTKTVEADVSLIADVTGWKAEIPLQKTIMDTLCYWRETVNRPVCGLGTKMV